MKIDTLIAVARESIIGSTPRYIDINQACENARQEITDMAYSRVAQAMETAILGAQSILKTTCEEYINALYVDDDMHIAIEQDKAYLESGYAPREMLDDLLASPKAKVSKEGDRYIKVPIGADKHTDVRGAIERRASELFSKGSGKASGRTLADMAKEMHSLAAKANPVQPSSGPIEFRVASENQDNRWKYNAEQPWVHPGFSGVNQLQTINMQLDSDLREQAAFIIRNEVDKMRR